MEEKQKFSNEDTYTQFHALLCQRNIIDSDSEITTVVERTLNDETLQLPEHHLVVLSNLAMACRHPHLTYVNHLTDRVEIPYSFQSIDNRFMGPCKCIFIDQTVQRYETLDGNASFKLFQPMDREHSFIRLDNGKIKSNSKLLTLVHRETALACRNFLSGLLPFRLLIDPLILHTITCTGPIRSHTDFIDTLLKERPDMLQRYRNVKGVGMFECNDKGVWWRMNDRALLKIISDLLKQHIPNLNIKEIKWIGQVNQLKLMCQYFESCVNDEGDKFQSKLNSNLNLFALENGVWDFKETPTGVFRPLRWDDYVSLTSNWEYSAVESALYMDKVVEFFKQVLPIYEERQCVLHFFGRLLDGVRDEKKISSVDRQTQRR
ncbi:hypothetical protein CEXT_649731 [Caerostris extrusa]|uniref:Uncharacterized protein n=1 Tax=Caerostris extrusa TaxID=172846 RepID=A0AAV4T8M8_CAEEX|nr:hypothetical protein CEXT_649731 [Caerostris extrusa]